MDMKEALKYISIGVPYVTSRGKKYSTVIVQCRCGKVFQMLTDNFKKRPNASCGCYQKERHDYHGMNRTPLYRRWESMKQRCYYVKHASYANYGGRGIKVCDEWLDFKNFRDWALCNGFDRKLELDRIDNNKDYSPTNCRWVTHSENNRNTRRNVFFEINGVRKTISEWSQQLNIPANTIKGRIKNNWPIDKIILKKC